VKLETTKKSRTTIFPPSSSVAGPNPGCPFSWDPVGLGEGGGKMVGYGSLRLGPGRTRYRPKMINAAKSPTVVPVQGGRLFELLPGRAHGRDLLAGEGPEGLGNEVNPNKSSPSLQYLYKADPLFELLPGGAHGRDLLAGEGPEGLSNEVRVGGHHLLPAASLHHVRHVPRVDELNCLEDERMLMNN
jgi:hypothetical protein